MNEINQSQVIRNVYGEFIKKMEVHMCGSWSKPCRIIMFVNIFN